jgi:putative transposase
MANRHWADAKSGFLHLAGVLNRCSHRCIGWAMSDTLATTLPLEALDMVFSTSATRPPAQFPSMSRCGNWHENALMEGFWSTLKRKLIHHFQFATRSHACAAIFEWIEVDYARARFPQRTAPLPISCRL